MELDLYFGEEHITSLVELGQKMYLYVDQAYSFIMREDFLLDLSVHEPFLFAKLQSIMDVEDDYLFVFKASYIFCPYMTFRYAGYKFENFKELGERILHFAPQIDAYLEDILKFRLLSWHMELQGKNKTNKVLYKRILEIENEYQSNSNFAYFTLGFQLSGVKVIIYKGRPYVYPKVFFEYMTNDSNITEFALEFEKNQYVFAWLKYLGYEAVLTRYHSLVELITAKENK